MQITSSIILFASPAFWPQSVVLCDQVAPTSGSRMEKEQIFRKRRSMEKQQVSKLAGMVQELHVRSSPRAESTAPSSSARRNVLITCAAFRDSLTQDMSHEHVEFVNELGDLHADVVDETRESPTPRKKRCSPAKAHSPASYGPYDEVPVPGPPSPFLDSPFVVPYFTDRSSDPCSSSQSELIPNFAHLEHSTLTLRAKLANFRISDSSQSPAQTKLRARRRVPTSSCISGGSPAKPVTMARASTRSAIELVVGKSRIVGDTALLLISFVLFGSLTFTVLHIAWQCNASPNAMRPLLTSCN
eukprot:gnl/MRDRNA2_/MRDRNA2_128259_c0_seq1.p1 gnl/MRDRNA2_/MRDRNA2_128259_c0~~gnl/MRDRNA2_/MRDRNA2_128259_c0_seq1.p1  ORF type:complete len:301 (+),score=29.32 gnl/MRDRNA2_/MRDRNA2_128259_c0_seq1:138-1040(+)